MGKANGQSKRGRCTTPPSRGVAHVLPHVNAARERRLALAAVRDIRHAANAPAISEAIRLTVHDPTLMLQTSDPRSARILDVQGTEVLFHHRQMHKYGRFRVTLSPAGVEAHSQLLDVIANQLRIDVILKAGMDKAFPSQIMYTFRLRAVFPGDAVLLNPAHLALQPPYMRNAIPFSLSAETPNAVEATSFMFLPPIFRTHLR